jgi:hypothetical protein
MSDASPTPFREQSVARTNEGVITTTTEIHMTLYLNSLSHVATGGAS